MMNDNQQQEIRSVSAGVVDRILAKEQAFIELDSLSGEAIVEQMFVKTQSLNLPDDLYEQYEKLQYFCLMGLVPELKRAWTTVDNKFFIWDYLNNSNFIEYDDLDQVILSVGIVKPRPNIFRDMVEYVLVLATSVQIVLVAVTVTKNVDSEQIELNLLPTNYTASTDNVNILKIAGTPSGRIFLAGQDGCLYELIYEERDGWVNKKCRKENISHSLVGSLVPSFLKLSDESAIIDLAVDTERNVLYTLSEQSTISVWDLGKSDDSAKRVVSYPSSLLMKEAKRLSSAFQTIDMKLISIFPISRSESKILHLVALTGSGEKLFFTVNASGLSIDSRPNTLELQKVRTASQKADVHQGYYRRGVFILAEKKAESLDHLLCFTHQLENQNLCETLSHLDIYGKSNAIAELQSSAYSDQDIVFNEIKSQHTKPAREFVCSSTNGIHLITKLRPVDKLQQILQTGVDPAQLDLFIRNYGRIETCCMCVLLVCNPSEIVHRDLSRSSIHDSNLEQLAADAFIKLGGEPKSDQENPEEPNENSSGHDGLYLCFARTVQPIWDKPFAVKVQQNQLKTIPQSNNIKRVLQGLEMFLKENTIIASAHKLQKKKTYESIRQRLFGSMTSDGRMIGGLHHLRRSEQAIRTELSSLQGLLQLVQRSIEAISYLEFLARFNVLGDTNNLKQEDLDVLLAFSFKDMILNAKGESTMKNLISTAIAKNSDVDAIFHYLGNYTTFLNADDLLGFRAKQKINILQTKAITDKHERDELFTQALADYKRITSRISVPEMCSMFQGMQFYIGAVELALAAAQQLDPLNLARDWVKRGKPTSDVQGRDLYMKRMKCYECALNVLHSLTFETGPQVAKELHQKVKRKVEIQSGEERKRIKAKVLQEMKNSTDELFHYALYEWYMKRPEQPGLRQELLEMKTPFLEKFLDQPKNYDFLWRYYETNNQIDKAAQVLQTLADSPGLKFDDRLEYLSKAIVHARALGMRDLVETLQDEYDVAFVQKKIISEITESKSIRDKKTLLTQLNSRLMSIDELFNNYANIHRLESCISALHCADHRDAQLIRELWIEVIDKWSQSGVVRTKVIEIGKEFKTAEARNIEDKFHFFFPLPLICAVMERVRLYVDTSDLHNSSERCVPDIMREIGITFGEIYGAYREIYSTLFLQDRYKSGEDLVTGVLASTPQVKRVLLSILSAIILDWVRFLQNPSIAASVEIRSMDGQILSHISEYQAELNLERSSQVQNIREKLEEAEQIIGLLI